MGSFLASSSGDRAILDCRNPVWRRRLRGGTHLHRVVIIFYSHTRELL